MSAIEFAAGLLDQQPENTSNTADEEPLEIISKSESFVHNAIDSKCSPTVRLELTRIKHDRKVEELEYEMQRLELKRKLMQAKYEAEIAKLETDAKCVSQGFNEHVHNDLINDEGIRIDEDIRVNREFVVDSSVNRFVDLCTRLELPKIELFTFSGDCSQYLEFMHQFETQVESRVKDNAQRLSYLMHYCKDKAHRAIRGCVMLPSNEGYARAKQILSELFGKPHMVARTLIERLVSGKPIRNSGEDLTEFCISMQNCWITLSQMSFLNELNSSNTLEKIVMRLPLNLQQKWVERAGDIYETGREPVFSDLTEFVRKRAAVASSRYGEMFSKEVKKRPDIVHNYQVMQSRTDRVNLNPETSVSRNTAKCCLCETEHTLDVCKVFLSMNVGNRWKLILRSKRCFICLEPGHTVRRCSKQSVCGEGGCSGLHHRLLHKMQTASDHSVNSTGCISGSRNSNRRVNLGLIAVKVRGPNGIRLTYALLDNGSDTTFISKELADFIGLKGENVDIAVKTINSMKSQRVTKASLTISSIDDLNEVRIEEAFVMDNLSLGVGSPLKSEQLQKWQHLVDIDVADIGDQDITILIGCSTPEAHWPLEYRAGGRQQPFAVRTVLGWTIMGPVSFNESHNSGINNHCAQTSIEQKIADLYNSEFNDLYHAPAYSLEDKDALNQVRSSLKLDNGHFEIGLPWKPSSRVLPNNRSYVVQRLNQLKKRFNHDDNLFKSYKAVIQGFLNKGYAERAADGNDSLATSKRWYLPHHPVINPRKPGKVRVVFDCASKFDGISLNDILLQGPNLVQNLVAVLTRFRLGRYALMGDIQEMFLQVKVPLHDRDYLSFVWWQDDDINKPIIDFRLTVHPFGAVSSPFCASYALQQCISIYKGDFNSAMRNLLSNHFYVDDCLMSANTEDELLIWMRELTNLLKSAGFRLTKWVSNSQNILKAIDSTELARPIIGMNLVEPPNDRTLGIQWDSRLDYFLFDVNLTAQPVTRRNILSCVSSLYDPLGLVCPVILPAKIILQELCRLKLGWDDKLDDEFLQLWIQWRDSMRKLGNLRIPRCISPEGYIADSLPELHVFSDASEKGYGTAAYLRYSMGENQYQCALLLGKSRVAPLKVVSVPRLELTAAVLGVKVAKFIIDEVNVNVSKVFYWTDSQTVLYYLVNTSTRYATFVANRVAFIREFSDVSQWNFVRGYDNPADHASRGLKSDDPKMYDWIHGPKFLRSAVTMASITDVDLVPVECEMKHTHHARIDVAENPVKRLIDQYSSWVRLVRAAVWIIRYKRYLAVMCGIRPEWRVSVGLVKSIEFKEAVDSLILIAQRDEFLREFDDLDRYNRVHRTSRLIKLNPTVCRGLLVIKGRVSGDNLPDRPILPSRHVVTELLIRHYHTAEGHMGVQYVLGLLRRKFWILKGVSSVKRVIKKCLRCRRLNTTPIEQQMAPLPSCRITPGRRAFEHTGLDFFGPLMVKVGRSVVKRWGCLFTCMKSRAIHIEIVHTMSTDSFIMALMRFANRRGKPKEVYSDNGSNLVGANAELKRALHELSQERINATMLTREIQWHFQPPASSHRGGVWERLIRSVRRILQAISTEQVTRDETLLTWISEVERIMNNRPLIPVSDDANDRVALTPNDLLLLESMDSATPTCIIDARRYTKWWKQANHLSNVFWKRWVREYLPLLEIRQKWHKRQRNVKVGDVVILVSEMTSRDQWPLGRIESVYISDDGLIRTADVRTSKGVLKRDVRKLCLLEAVLDGENSDSDHTAEASE